MIWIWAIVVALALVVEFSTPDMVSIWFAVGGLVALILAACSVPIWIQTVSFVVVSFALLLTLRKVVSRLLAVKDEKTNADAMLGQTFILLEGITKDKPGKLKISGVEWTAILHDDTELVAGQRVIVLEIKGNKLVVKGE